jgi:hypothetical protein
MQHKVSALALAAIGLVGFAGSLQADDREDALQSVTPIYQAEEAALNRPGSNLREAFDHYTPALQDRLAASFERGRQQYSPERFAISLASSRFEDGVLTVTWRVTAIVTDGAFPARVSQDCEDQWRQEDGRWVAFNFRRVSPLQVVKAHDSGEAQRLRYGVLSGSLQKTASLR